jgi:hypothetical protein
MVIAGSPSPSIHVSTRKRLAVSWLHRPRSGRRPVNIRVRCKTVGAAILRLKKLDVNSIRYLVAAAATCRLHSTVMCGAHIQTLELMEDAVVAITKTQSTEAKRRAPSRSNLIRYQCRSQRPPAGRRDSCCSPRRPRGRPHYSAGGRSFRSMKD